MPDLLSHIAGFAVAWLVLGFVVATVVALLIRGGARRQSDSPASPARWTDWMHGDDYPNEDDVETTRRSRRRAR